MRPLPQPPRRRPAGRASVAPLALVAALLAACCCHAAAAKPCSAYHGGKLAAPPGNPVRDTGLGFSTVRRAGRNLTLPRVGEGEPCGHALGVCTTVSARLGVLPAVWLPGFLMDENELDPVKLTCERLLAMP